MASSFPRRSGGLIPEGFVQELLARTDIVDVVGRHVQLKKGGANLLGLCPFHGEKSPSFTVSPAKQFYHCFGCGAHGDALRFVMEHQGLGFVDAVQELAQRVGLNVPQSEQSPQEREQAQRHRERQSSLNSVLEQAAAHYRERLKGDERAIGYLRRRGLSGEVARDFGLGYAPGGWRNLASAFARYDDPLLVESGLVISKSTEPAAGHMAQPLAADANLEADASRTEDGAANEVRYDRFRDRIMFPIRSVKGEVIGFGGRVLDAGEPKYLNSPETPLFVKGRELYGLFEARQAIRERGHALVVEGYMDVVALAQSGIGNAVATLGTACTTEHVQKLFRFTDHVVFSFDGDAAGRRAAGRALEAALPQLSELRTVRFLFLPPEHDPDSYVRELGPEAFEEALRAAWPLSRQLLAHAGQDADLGTPEGRARMLAKAQPLWALLAPGALKRQLLGALAEAAGLSADALAADWERSPPAARNANPSDGEGPKASGRLGTKGRGAETALRPPLASQRRSLGSRLRAPAGVADVALRLLLRHTELWQGLGAEDQQLLHELGGVHAELVIWLERHCLEHGPSPWPGLREALRGSGLAEAAQALMPSWDRSSGDLSDEDSAAAQTEFAVVLKRLRLAQLEEKERVLAAAATQDASVMAQYREARAEAGALREALRGAAPSSASRAAPG
jgi:DNA primase